MGYPDIATREDLAHELSVLAKDAGATECLLSHVESVIAAICRGGLLDAAPAGDSDRERHNAAVILLSDAYDKLKAHEDRPGTDTSISLGVLASDVSKGRFAHKRVLEGDADGRRQ
jgi:hypothetical protein